MILKAGAKSPRLYPPKKPEIATRHSLSLGGSRAGSGEDRAAKLGEGEMASRAELRQESSDQIKVHIIRMLCLFCLAAVFIAWTGSTATAACEDYSGLESVYQGAENTGAFSSIAYLGDGIVVAGKRRWNESAPNVAIYRSTDYGQSWNTVPNPSGLTGRHVYFFGQHGSRVFAGTGDEGNVCLMRSDDHGASWSVVLTTAELRTLARALPRIATQTSSVWDSVLMGVERRAAPSPMRSIQLGAGGCRPASSGTAAVEASG